MSEHTAPIAIVGATILDGNGGEPIDEGVILIEGGRISAIGGRSTEVPSEATKIAATGKYVMPGMMDASVHLFLAISDHELVRYEGLYEEVVAEAAQVALRCGLTTVFDTWGPADAVRRVRDRIACHELVGSRVFFAGNIVGLGGPTSTDFLPQSKTVLGAEQANAIDGRWEQGVGPDLLWMTSEEVRARIRDYIARRRPDFLHYAASDHVQCRFICFSEKVQRILVEEGHRAGMTVQAFTASPESLRIAIEAGVDLVHDITGPVPLPEETLALISARQIPCAAMLVTRRFLAWNDEHGSETLATVQRVKDENDRRLIAAGAPFVLASDSGVIPSNARETPWLGHFAAADDSPMSLGDAHFRWLQAASELDMSPMDALMASTRNVARAYNVDKDLGTLERGKIADLLILDKNPFEAARNYESISLIMKDGRVVDRESLPSRRVLTA